MRVDRSYIEKHYAPEDARVVVALQNIMARHKPNSNIYVLAKRFRARITTKGSDLGEDFYKDTEKALNDVLESFMKDYPLDSIKKYRMARANKEPFSAANIRWVHK